MTMDGNADRPTHASPSAFMVLLTVLSIIMLIIMILILIIAF